MSRKPKYVVRIGSTQPAHTYGTTYASLYVEVRMCSPHKPTTYVANELERGYMSAETADKFLRECRDRDAKYVCETGSDSLTFRFQASPDVAVGEWYGLRLEDMPCELWACNLLAKLLKSDSAHSPYAIARWLDAEGAAIGKYCESAYRCWTIAHNTPSVSESIPATPWQPEPAQAATA